MAEASPPPFAEVATLTEVLDDLARRGFTEHFTARDGWLRGVESGTLFAAADVVVAEHHRFEGVSDPDDMSILYALETRGGISGTLVDAFGVYSDPLVSAFMRHVRVRSHLP
ncbi:MAG TPA: phosphoribosylpyrophosphate synthetase [Methylomirabilota bacterium]|nr:phosphoribosylpyrophosphate synthetase [Methylomirabilota bacterium]